MKKYIRFGEIPIYERSINYFTYLYEDGVSAFNIDNNGEIVLNNMRSISTLLTRLGETAYFITGTEVNTGNDGEPLLRDVKILEEAIIDKYKIFDQVHNILEKNSSNKKGSRLLQYDYIKQNNNHLCSFSIDLKKCKHCGKTINHYDSCKHNGKECAYESLPSYTQYSFDGIDYWNFNDDFDTNLGLNKERYLKHRHKTCIKCNDTNIKEDLSYWDINYQLYICDKCGFKTQYPKKD